MGRKLRILLDRIHPDFTLEKQLNKDAELARNYEKRKTREFLTGDQVLIRSFGPNSKWTPAQIIRQTGPLSYKTVTAEGHTQARHLDAIRDCDVPSSSADKFSTDGDDSQPQQTNEKITQMDKLPKFSPRPQRTHQRPKYLEEYVPR